MILHSGLILSREDECRYIEGRMWRFSYFFASNVSGDELESLLSSGWRKFGIYYFRPECDGCRECIPIRVLTEDLRLTKSQRRVARRCSDVKVKFADLEYRDEIFDIYSDHSMTRFGKGSDPDEFYRTFYTQSCPSIQSEYYIGDELAAVGFIDISSDSLSSVYFIYRDSFSKYRLGTYSVITESEYARSSGLKYYYLGYYIAENGHMAYKGSFYSNEKMDWISGVWLKERAPGIT